MPRRLVDLEGECIQKGIELPAKYGKRELEELLAEHGYKQLFKELTHVDRLPQIEAMCAHDFKDYSEQDKEEILDSPDWVAEEKLNGDRMKVHITENGLRLDGRTKSVSTYIYTERTENFPHLKNCQALKAYAGTVLDAEILMLNESIDTGSVVTVGTLTSTSATVNCAPEKAIEIQKQFGNAHLFVFDIARWCGKKFDATLERRRVVLEKIFERHPELEEANIHLVPQRLDKQEFFKEVTEKGGEGVMLKDKSGSYAEGKRVRCWLKWKKVYTIDGFITGWVKAKADRGWANLVGALEVSVIDDQGKVRIIGAPQPGTLEFRKEISNPDGSLKAEWYGKCVEVQGNEWTKNMRLQHCVLVRWRPDKNKEDCILDMGKIRAKVKAGHKEAC